MKVCSNVEAQEIILSLSGTPLLVHQPSTSAGPSPSKEIKYGSIGMSLEEAEALANDILNECQEYRTLLAETENPNKGE